MKNKTKKSFYRFLIYLFLMLSQLYLSGQILLDSSDLPKTGDVQISIKVDSIQAASLSPGIQGENIQWDFSDLVACCGIQSSQDTVKWLDRRDVDVGNFFTGAEIAINTNCVKYHSHVTHQDETRCYYDYYFKDDQGLKLYGFDYPNNTLSQEFQLVFPLLAYGDTIVNPSRTVFNLSADSTRILSVTDSISVDAWGTLITPVDTFNTIRVRTIETVFDSLYINGSLQSTESNTGYGYKWYRKGLGYPVLQINQGTLSNNPVSKTGLYSKTSYNTVGISEINNQTDNVKVYPNPSTQTTTFYFTNFKDGDYYTLTIFSSRGQQLMHVDNIRDKELTISIGNMATGLYFYRISNKQGMIKQGKLIFN